MIFSIVFIYNCNNKDSESLELDCIETSYVSIDSVFSSKATFGGKIKELPKNATDHGFVFSETSNPEIETDSVISLGIPDFTGDFFQFKYGLKPGIKYYMRAYLSTDKKTYYGSDIDFCMTLIRYISPEGAGRLDTIILYGTNFDTNKENNNVKFDDTSLETILVTQGMFGSEIKAVIPYEIDLGEKTVTIEINNTATEYGEKFTVDPYVSIPDFPGTKRHYTVGFTINELFYIGMGYDENKNYKNDFYCYNHSSQTWTKISDYPGDGRKSAVAFTINNKAYVGLGKKESTHFKDFYEFDPLTQNWTLISEFPGEGRYGSVAFSIEGMGYVLFGSIFSAYLNEIYRYDPESDNWTKLNDFPYSADYYTNASAFVKDQTALLYLGIDFDSKLLTYDHNDDTWEIINDPDHVADPITLVIKNDIYNFDNMNVYYIYDNSNWWENIYLKGRDRNWFDIGLSNGEFAVLGLDYELFSQKLWIFDPE